MASNISHSPHLLNPMTPPMAFLPPDIAFQSTVASYIAVGSCAVMIWDILENLRNDHRLLSQFDVRPPTIIYFISRLSALGYVLTATMFETMSAPWGCSRLLDLVSIFIVITIPATCLLFFLRLRAIFHHGRFISLAFGLLWVTVLASCSTFIFGSSAANIGSTHYCMVSRLEDYVASAAIIPLIYDSLVFGAITWRMTMYSDQTTVVFGTNTGIKAILRGEYLPAFTRGILQDGQAYYLMTNVVACFTTVLMLYVPNLPKVYRTMFVPPNVVFINIMACKVFRKTKFGIFQEDSVSMSRVLGGLATTPNSRSLQAPLEFQHYTGSLASQRGNINPMLERCKSLTVANHGAGKGQQTKMVEM